MSEFDIKELLKNREVQEEIDRHKWFESERAGYDIGYETAAEDWLKKFSAAWMAYNMPTNKSGKPDNLKNLPPEVQAENAASASLPKSKRRKAKSYVSKT